MITFSAVIEKRTESATTAKGDLQKVDVHDGETTIPVKLWKPTIDVDRAIAEKLLVQFINFWLGCGEGEVHTLVNVDGKSCTLILEDAALSVTESEFLKKARSTVPTARTADRNKIVIPSGFRRPTFTKTRGFGLTRLRLTTKVKK